MTEKERERNVLEQVRKLLEPTFYCKTALWDALDYAERNIADDACYNPVEELRDEYDKGLKKDSEMGAKLVRIEHERDCLAETIKAQKAEIEKLGHMLDSKVAECKEVMEQRDALADCVDGHNEITEKQDRIVRQMLNKGFAREETGCGDERYGYCYAVTEIAEAFGVKGEEIRTIRESIRAMAESDTSVVERIADMKVKGVYGND